jgi:4-amino-4-deoxy-L-arabinose transferase-like glycosyltransferase
MSLKSKAALIILIGIACFFSLYKLTESPPLWYDEGIYDQLALNSALGHGPTIQVAPGEFVSGAFVTGGYPFIRPIAWTFQLFGIGVFQSRIVMAFFIIAALIGFFFLLRALFGTRSALISLALLGSFPMLYGNGKNVLGEIPGLFYLSLFLLAVFQIEKQKFQGILPYILAGISGGLCLSTKPIFFLLGGAVVVASILCRKHIIFNWRSLIVGFISFLIPLGIWVGLQFHATDSATTILQYYANPYGIPDLMGQIDYFCIWPNSNQCPYKGSQYK